MANETGLPPRYEIRTLGLEHLEWAKALIIHSNLFYSPVWPAVYPEGLTARTYKSYDATDYLVRHQIESGYSLGIFDTEYKFKRPESAATGGKLYWDFSDESATAEQLLEQMDFPLVSHALAYDSINPLDHEKMGPLIGCLPMFGAVYGMFMKLDVRDPKTWQATAPGEVLFRNSTSTRHDVETKGLMKKLAQYMMRKSAAEGFRGIQIECLHDAVAHVWSHPPEPFKAEVVCEFRVNTYEEVDAEGNKTFPMSVSTQNAVKIYVALK